MALPIRAFLVRCATLPSIEKMPETRPCRVKWCSPIQISSIPSVSPSSIFLHDGLDALLGRQNSGCQRMISNWPNFMMFSCRRDAET